MSSFISHIEDEHTIEAFDLSAAQSLLEPDTDNGPRTMPSRRPRIVFGKHLDLEAPFFSTSNSVQIEHGIRELGKDEIANQRLNAVPVPFLSLSAERFETLQSFEGVVESVNGDSFVAKLTDKTHGGHEEAEFPLEEVSLGDRRLVQSGAEFYWVLGREVKPHGQISRASIIRFKRIPSWTSDEVEQAMANAKTFLSFVDVDAGNESS